VIPVAVGIGALLALAALAWTVPSTRALFHHARTRRRSARKIGHGNAVAARTPNQDGQLPSERNEREAAVIRDAERALAQARREGDEIIAAAEAKAAKMQSAAEQKARTIIREAEEKAGELAESAELHAAREREAAAKTRDELTSLLRNLLAEAKGSPATGPANIDTIGTDRAAGEAR
jgi:hypothetical protein